MNNKSVFYIIGLMLFIIVIAVIIYFNYNILSLRNEWDITMPTQDESIYYIDNAKKFPKNGERYQVLKYNNASKIDRVDKSVEWVENKDSLIEDKVNNILEILKASSTYYPNFNLSYKYYYYEIDYSKELILIYISSENKLYVVENL